MKRRTNILFRQKLGYSLLLFICILLVSPISAQRRTRSVKKIKEAHAAYVPKPSDGAMIQPLFMQNKKANIAIPKGSKGGVGGGAVAVEQTTYTNSNNHSDVFDQALDTERTYELDDVVVEVKSTFAPERNGKISVDFVVKVPKEVLSQNWMLKMSPYVIGRDSLQYLRHLVIKGNQFALKQEFDYKAYDDFLSSIVPKEDYNKVFLDHEGIEKDIKDRLQFYYEQYQAKWALHKEYETWYEGRKAEKAVIEADLKGQIAEMQYDFNRRLLTHANQDIARGVDTTGLAISYHNAFMKKSTGLRNRLAKSIASEIEVPKKYQEVHAMPMTSQNIGTLGMTTQDTLDIVRNRYMVDKIAENELKLKRKDIVRKEMIPFPYDEKALIDSIIDTGRDFSFYYKQQLPVVPGMKNVKIAMKTDVIAIDQSRYNMRSSDTLTYFISSIAQLVDTTLLSKETVRNRNLATKKTLNLDYRPNTWRFDVNYKNNIKSFESLVKDYNVFANNPSYAVDSILLQVSTSLDGTWAGNYELSRKRAEDLKSFLASNSKMGKMGANAYIAKYRGEDWNTLARLVKSNNNLPNKAAILDILANTQKPDESKAQIAKEFPEDFKVIKNEIYPQLDKVDVIFYVHRTDMTSDKEVIKVDREYVKAIRLLQDREYQAALDILVNYPDYNAAVALSALGYNGKAYDLLSKLKSDGNVEYLSAITAWRLKQEQAAINHLMKAIQLDPSKLYRIDLDADIVDMIQKHNLRDRINQINN